MADIEGMFDSIALGFFCNSMVEELYYMGKNNSISERLEENCKKAINEFESLQWPLVERSYPNLDESLFRNNLNLQTFENAFSEYYNEEVTSKGIDKLIWDLRYIISDNSITERVEKAEELQKFFDFFGDYAYYATKDCIRC